MTGEMHAIIVRNGAMALLEKSAAELRKIEPWLTKKHLRWVAENPVWPDPEMDRAYEIIKRAAALLQPPA